MLLESEKELYDIIKKAIDSDKKLAKTFFRAIGKSALYITIEDKDIFDKANTTYETNIVKFPHNIDIYICQDSDGDFLISEGEWDNSDKYINLTGFLGDPKTMFRETADKLISHYVEDPNSFEKVKNAKSVLRYKIMSDKMNTLPQILKTNNSISDIFKRHKNISYVDQDIELRSIYQALGKQIWYLYTNTEDIDYDKIKRYLWQIDSDYSLILELMPTGMLSFKLLKAYNDSIKNYLKTGNYNNYIKNLIIDEETFVIDYYKELPLRNFSIENLIYIRGCGTYGNIQGLLKFSRAKDISNIVQKFSELLYDRSVKGYSESWTIESLRSNYNDIRKPEYNSPTLYMRYLKDNSIEFEYHEKDVKETVKITSIEALLKLFNQ